MLRLAPIALGLALAATLGCANRTDQRVREAWNDGALDPGGRDGPGPSRGQEGQVDEPGSMPIRVGWDRVDEIVGLALAEAMLGTDDEVMARLAKQWCTVEPVAQGEGDLRRRACVPNPPVRIDGTAFTLELGGEGVIGLVATELSEEQSAQLAEEARRRTSHFCNRQWTDVSPRPTETKPAPPPPQLYTCTVEGSALLAVGRFVSDSNEGWQVSVAVIDAS